MFVYQPYIVDMSLMYYHWIICPGTCTLHFAMIAVSNGENIICTHLYLIQYISYIKRNISSIIQTVGSVNEYIWSRIVDRKKEVVEISLAVNEKSADWLSGCLVKMIPWQDITYRINCETSMIVFSYMTNSWDNIIRQWPLNDTETKTISIHTCHKSSYFV